jgi:hypothetical protein
LARLDATIGFRWSDWAAIISTYPLIVRMQEFAYQSYVWQPATSIIVFAIWGPHGRNRELLTSLLLALTLTMAVSMFLPAIGPADTMGFPHLRAPLYTLCAIDWAHRCLMSDRKLPLLPYGDGGSFCGRASRQQMDVSNICRPQRRNADRDPLYGRPLFNRCNQRHRRRSNRAHRRPPIAVVLSEPDRSCGCLRIGSRSGYPKSLRLTHHCRILASRSTATNFSSRSDNPLSGNIVWLSQGALSGSG